MTGAADLKACPTKGQRGWCACGEPCVVCGYREHFAIHGPKYGQPPGSEPWGHEFKPPEGGDGV